MKKISIKEFIMKNKDLLLGMIVGFILSSTTVFAVIKYASNNVFYRNTDSHLNSTTVQSAIDELYTTCTTTAYTLTADSKGGVIPTTSGWNINGSTATKTVIFNGTYGTLPTPTKNGYSFEGWFTKESGGTQITSSSIYRYSQDSTIHAHWTGNTYTATFYYQSNEASGSTTISTKTASCVLTNGNSCNVTIPSEVTDSVGTYNNKYVGLSTSTGNMIEDISESATTVALTGNTVYYSLYRTNVTNYYWNSSSYSSRYLYRNQWFTNGSTLSETVLSSSVTGMSNYEDALGPGNSDWVGLSTGNDTTAEYVSIAGAASSSSTILYTVYQMNVIYSKGVNVSSIGDISGSCKLVSASTNNATTPNGCNVELPSITASTGYVSVGWGTSSGATTGSDAGTNKFITTNTTTLYANANCQGVPSNTYTVGNTISYAGSNWTVVKDNGTTVDLAYNGKIDANGSTTGTTGGTYTGATTAVDSWLKLNSITKAALQDSCIVNNGSSSNTKTNGPSVPYWLDSGKINEPEQINTYSTYSSVYASGRSGAKTSLADVMTSVLTESLNTTYATTVQYEANSTINLSNSNSSITYNNARLTQTSKGNVSQHILWNNPNRECGTPGINYMPRHIGLLNNGWQAVWEDTCYNDNGADYVRECDGTWSQVNAEGASAFAYKSSYWDDYVRYWSENVNLYFGWAGSPSVSIASGSSEWFFRVYDMSCPSVTVYNVANLQKSIYYRPFIQVVKQ